MRTKLINSRVATYTELVCVCTHTPYTAVPRFEGTKVVTIQSEEIFPLYTSNFVNFGIFEKFLDRPPWNPQTNPNPFSQQAGGEHIKSSFFTI